MAGRRVNISTEGAAQALAAATIETVVEVTAPANQALLIKGWGVSFDGASVTAVPVEISLAVKSVAGTGAAATERDIDEDFSGTIQAAGRTAVTVEGTVTYDFEDRHIHPQTGFEIWYPEGEELKIVPAGITGVRVNASAVVNAHAFMRVHE